MTRMTETTTARGAGTHHQALGRYGETLAARHLIELGMVLLDRNWSCRDGEADLVLRDGRTLVVCEVKTRSNHEHGSPHEAVTPEKVERMGRVAQAWLAAHDVTPQGVRLDLVAVLRPRRGASVVEHVQGLS
jgi:putative endonuclease